MDKSTISMFQIGKKYLDEIHNFNRITDNSYNRRLATLKLINRHYIASKEIQKITGDDIKNFLVYLTQYANSTIGKAYGLSNTIFKIAIKKNIIKYNFFDDTFEYPKPKSSKPTKIIRAFTIEEQKEFLDVIFNKEKRVLYKVQFILSMYCGMRMGEINALYLSDIDFNTNSINITRTLTKDINDYTIMGDTTKTYSSTRIIYFSEEVKTILSDYINTHFITTDFKIKETLLFPNNKNNKKYISTAQVNSAFKRLCQKYNISKGWDVNQHMLRHTFATRCIEAGTPAKVLQKILGHADIKTTLDVYCDVFNAYEKKHRDNTFEYLKNNNLTISSVQ